MLKRDVDPLRLALRPLLLHKASSQSVFSNYNLIVHILTISSHNDVMGFGLREVPLIVFIFVFVFVFVF